MRLAERTVVETYTKSKPALEKLVRQCKKTYGGDYDDLMGEADVLFMLAVGGYDPEAGVPWLGYLGFLVSKRLASVRRTEVRRGRLVRYDAEADLDAVAEPQTFDLETLCERLSDDAEAVVRLATKPRTVPDRERIKTHLLRNGWSKARVGRAFREVKQTL